MLKYWLWKNSRSYLELSPQHFLEESLYTLSHKQTTAHVVVSNRILASCDRPKDIRKNRPTVWRTDRPSYTYRVADSRLNWFLPYLLKDAHASASFSLPIFWIRIESLQDVKGLSGKVIWKQGRTHGSISRVRVGRGSNSNLIFFQL